MALALNACDKNSSDATVTPDTATAEGEGDSAEGEGHHAGGEAKGEGHHGGEHPEGEKHGHDFAPEMAAFHDAMKPHWHAEVGEARTTATCDAAATLIENAKAVAAGTAPEGATDAEAYTTQAGALVSAAEGLDTSCKGDRADFEDKFKAVHEAFHGLMKIAMPKHD